MVTHQSDDMGKIPQTPLVSVCITAYNQRDYIAQALDSVLGQETRFPIEIIVGEDDSADGTRVIVKTYAEQHADRIRPFFNDRKDVIYIDGKATARWNFLNLVSHARGKYIALLEGDDYWTDPLKLQQQVDALESAPECSFSFHRAGILEEKSNRIVGEMPNVPVNRVVSLNEILSAFFIPTCSVIYRRGQFGDFPEWYRRIPAGDWPLHVLNAMQGPALFLDSNMAVYRIHSDSYWSSRTNLEQLAASKKTIQMMRKVVPKINHPSMDELEYDISRLMFHESVRSKQYSNAFRFFSQMIDCRGSRSIPGIFWNYATQLVADRKNRSPDPVPANDK